MVETVVRVVVWDDCGPEGQPVVVQGCSQLVQVVGMVQTVGHSPKPRLDSLVGLVVVVQHHPVWVRMHKVEMGVLV
jgi:hypothetical protein